MNVLAGRRHQHAGYEHVSQYDDDNRPTSAHSDNERDVELLDVEVACKAYANHNRSRSNSSLSSLGSIITSFAPGNSAYLRTGTARQRIRLFRRLVHVVCLAFVLYVFLTPILNPSYVQRPYHYSGRNLRREKVFIAANIVDEELIRGPWGERVVELVDLLGRDNVFLSIYENDSGLGTKTALQELSKKVKCKTAIISDHIDINMFPQVQMLPNEERVKRIAYLAHVRNKAIEPLASNTTGMNFDKLLFINDVIFSPSDAADLLFSTNMGEDGATRYHAACAMDFINPFKYYDTFATRDAEGHGLGVPFFPFFTSAGHGYSRRDIVSGTDAVRVKSCWGGMVAFEAKWFMAQPKPKLPVTETHDLVAAMRPVLSTKNQVRFRSLSELMWEASECCLVHADIGTLTAQNPEPWEDPHSQDFGIYINPFIRVAYDVHTHSWLEFTRRFEQLYITIHGFVNWLVSRPPYHPRVTEEPGETISRNEWIFDGPFEDDIDRTHLRSSASALTNEVTKYGHWEMVEQIVTPGSFCGGRQSLLLNPQPWSPSERIWYKVVPPHGSGD